MTDSANIKARAMAEVIRAVLAALGVASMAFGGWLLWLALETLAYEGEQWGFLAVMFYGAIGGLVQLILVLVAMDRWIRDRRWRIGGFKWSLWLNVAALVLTLAAFACIPLAQYQHQQRYQRDNALYQSGLHEAVERGDVEAARRIIRSNPSLLQQTGYEGYTPLMLAVAKDDLAMARMLLEEGADPNDGSFKGSPLHQAARNAGPDIVRLLLDKGARINEEDSQHRTPLVIARELRRTQIEDLLVSRGGQDVDKAARIRQAVERGDRQAVTALLDEGIPVETHVANGTALLDAAAENGDVEMARLLVLRGASVKRANHLRRTPLHYAAWKGKTAVAEFLINQGADINAQDWEGQAPLHGAVYWAQSHPADALAVIKLLIAKGAAPQIRDNEGRTPAELAKKYGTDDVRALLAGSKTDPRIPGQRHLNPASTMEK